MDIKTKNVALNGNNYKIVIWDTAGQERYRSIPLSYYQNCNGILLACDMSQADGISKLEFWLYCSKTNAPNVPVILVGTKSDLVAQIPVDVFRVLSNEKGIPFIQTSSKTGDGVHEAFENLLEMATKRKNPSSELSIKQVKLLKTCQNKKKKLCCEK